MTTGIAALVAMASISVALVVSGDHVERPTAVALYNGLEKSLADERGAHQRAEHDDARARSDQKTRRAATFRWE